MRNYRKSGRARAPRQTREGERGSSCVTMTSEPPWDLIGGNWLSAKAAVLLPPPSGLLLFLESAG